MPRDETSMSVCPPTKSECVEEALEEVETGILDTKTSGSIGQKCYCLPACTEMKFPHTLSSSRMDMAKNLKLKNSLKEAISGLTDDNFIKDNIAVVHIFFENLHFLKHERGEVSSIATIFKVTHATSY